MRKIKFRAWDGENYHHEVNLNNSGQVMVMINGKYAGHNDWPVEQYTELKDKNGKDKYPGDIKLVYEVEPIYEMLGEPQNGKSHVDTEIKTYREVIEFEKEIAENYLGEYYDREDIFENFGISEDADEEEIQECIIDTFIEAGAEVSTIQDILDLMNYGLIIGTVHENPELLKKEI